MSFLYYNLALVSFNFSQFHRSISPQSINISVEESIGVRRLRVVRTRDPHYFYQTPPTVSFTTIEGTALAGTHYVHTTGNFSWAYDDFSDRFIDIPIIDIPGIDDTDRTFSVLLYNAANWNPVVIPGSIWPYNQVNITIADVDRGSIIAPVSFRPVSLVAQVMENTPGFINLQVTRVGSTIGIASVDYETVDGTALAGTHFTFTDSTLTWADGEAGNKTITVPIIDNATADGNVEFTVLLSDPVNGVIDSGQDEISVTIIDDETTPAGAGEISFVTPTISISEGAGTVQVYVQRTLGSVGELTVEWYTEDDSAADGIDYTSSYGTLTWTNGDMAPKLITIPIIDEALVRPNRTFKIILVDPVFGTGGTGGITGSILGDDFEAIVTIIDDDKYTDYIDCMSFVGDKGQIIENLESFNSRNILTNPYNCKTVGTDFDQIGPCDGTSSNNHGLDYFNDGATRAAFGRVTLMYL
jgi:hypothetical protein